MAFPFTDSMSNILQGMGGSSNGFGALGNQTSNILGSIGATSRGGATSLDALSALANQGNKPGFFQGLGNQFAQGGTMSNLLGGVAQIGGLVGGISDFINNRKFLKSNLESMALQREIARENLAMQRAEYDRLKRNRAAITKAYGG